MNHPTTCVASTVARWKKAAHEPAARPDAENNLPMFSRILPCMRALNAEAQASQQEVFVSISRIVVQTKHNWQT